MASFYSEKDKHFIAVDCIIFGFDDCELKLLLLKRGFEPSKGEWSLTGGFVHQDEEPDQAARRVLKQLTGLDQLYMDQLHVFGKLDRDPGGRVISIAYSALIRIEEYDKNLVEQSGAYWVPISKIPHLVFDHNEMVALALENLKRKAKIQPIGFELLPEQFTIPQLQALYEAINQKELDTGNFRRKFLKMGLLKKLNIKDKKNSKKGAFYYQFDQKKYESFLKKGFVFDI